MTLDGSKIVVRTRDGVLKLSLDTSASNCFELKIYWDYYLILQHQPIIYVTKYWT